MFVITQSDLYGLDGGPGDEGYPGYQGGFGIYAEHSEYYIAETNLTGARGADASVGGLYCNNYAPGQPGGHG